MRVQSLIQHDPGSAPCWGVRKRNLYHQLGFRVFSPAWWGRTRKRNCRCSAGSITLETVFISETIYYILHLHHIVGFQCLSVMQQNGWPTTERGNLTVHNCLLSVCWTENKMPIFHIWVCVTLLVTKTIHILLGLYLNLSQPWPRMTVILKDNRASFDKETDWTWVIKGQVTVTSQNVVLALWMQRLHFLFGAKTVVWVNELSGITLGRILCVGPRSDLLFPTLIRFTVF